MAMNEIFEKLRILQDILSAKIVLERDIQEIPKGLITQEELLIRLKKSFVENNAEYEKALIRELEFRNKLLEAGHTREQAEKNMGITTTQREFEALDKEIKDAASKEQLYRRELQREERAILDLNTVMKQTSAMIKTQEQELAERKIFIETEIAEKKQTLAALNLREQEIIPGITEDVLFKFDRIVRNKKGKGIVGIKGGVCTGCHMILPAQFANRVRIGEEIVFCPYCSRILFYEESDQNAEEFFYDEEGGSLSDLDDIDDEEELDDEEDKLINIDYED
ncbi:MAG: C4-type zinc ribbon domain-containing protein [Spirochaetaceae bacterium]|jgi:predicted  nucleic acid-binding Zn-ribbon protein|nr:C4-type zinc ribbon domain-containing protein [Spirochaetaceae bacterium]